MGPGDVEFVGAALQWGPDDFMRNYLEVNSSVDLNFVATSGVVRQIQFNPGDGVHKVCI